MSEQRESRVDNARVQSIIDLLNPTSTMKRTGVRNITRTLTPKQYEQLLRVIEDPNNNSVLAEVKDSLPFEYSCSKNRFEIRVPTPMHASIQGLVGGSIGEWHVNLMESNDPRISDISEAILSLSSEHLNFLKVQELKKQKRQTGEYDMCALVIIPSTTIQVNLSNGEIRTIVAVHMHDMFLAERKNEVRLKRMYRKGEVDKSYCYWEDENNQTGSASILVWRARKRRDGTVEIGNAKEKVRALRGSVVELKF
ncbi:hypothetical protein ANO14919_045100 [Xylariales sp. No.14919]|nr:hypothetical protein ANO14919_045100 [Xylariales sp. No.14919]